MAVSLDSGQRHGSCSSALLPPFLSFSFRYQPVMEYFEASLVGLQVPPALDVFVRALELSTRPIPKARFRQPSQIVISQAVTDELVTLHLLLPWKSAVTSRTRAWCGKSPDHPVRGSAREGGWIVFCPRLPKIAHPSSSPGTRHSAHGMCLHVLPELYCGL